MSQASGVLTTVSAGMASLGPACGRNRGQLSDRHSCCPPSLRQPSASLVFAHFQQKRIKTVSEYGGCSDTEVSREQRVFRSPLLLQEGAGGLSYSDSVSNGGSYRAAAASNSRNLRDKMSPKNKEQVNKSAE